MRSRSILMTLTSSFFVLAGAFAGLGVIAAPASAAQTSVDVAADMGWTDTGIDVTAGQPVHLSATGTWDVGALFDASGVAGTPGPTGPDGYPFLWGDNFLNLTDIGNGFLGGVTPTPHFGALVGIVGPHPPGLYAHDPGVRPTAEQVFPVGSDLTFTPAQSGRLWLAINDAAYTGHSEDNSGSMHVTTDYRSPTTCVVTGLRAGPPKQQDVTVSDLDGVSAIVNIHIVNGTVAVPSFSADTTSPIVVTATKTDPTQTTTWDFDVVDSFGDVHHCA